MTEEKQGALVKCLATSSFQNSLNAPCDGALFLFKTYSPHVVFGWRWWRVLFNSVIKRMGVFSIILSCLSGDTWKSLSTDFNEDLSRISDVNLITKPRPQTWAVNLSDQTTDRELMRPYSTAMEKAGTWVKWAYRFVFFFFCHIEVFSVHSSGSVDNIGTNEEVTLKIYRLSTNISKSHLALPLPPQHTHTHLNTDMQYISHPTHLKDILRLKTRSYF